MFEFSQKRWVRFDSLNMFLLAQNGLSGCTFHRIFIFKRNQETKFRKINSFKVKLRDRNGVGNPPSCHITAKCVKSWWSFILRALLLGAILITSGFLFYISFLLYPFPFPLQGICYFSDVIFIYSCFYFVVAVNKYQNSHARVFEK